MKFVVLERRNAMRVMVIVKATPESEAGQMPTMELIAAMGKYNEELVKAGIMQGGDGLKPSSAGVRVRFAGKDRTVVDGPFAETKELIAGYWLWQVQSMDEAIEWVKRCPNPMTTLRFGPFLNLLTLAKPLRRSFEKRRSVCDSKLTDRYANPR
jgi:hypothetical protein